LTLIENRNDKLKVKLNILVFFGVLVSWWQEIVLPPNHQNTKLAPIGQNYKEEAIKFQI
jgi:hypothetical protein